MGQDDRLKDKNLNFNSNDIALAKPDARYNFIPGRTLQEDFVNQYAPKTITIGIGGNDAGLVEKLTDCVSTNTCSWASDIVKREQTAKEIKGVYSKLVNTYQKLHQDSPESKIYAIGYPKVVDETGDCGMLLNSFLDNTEKKFMNETIKYLNKVVEQAAKAAGVKYVDVYDSFGGQLLCGNKSPAAMNGIRKGEETNPIGDSDWFRVIGSESFHPTAEGHKLIAKQIVNTLGDISSYEYCPGGATICPDQSAAAPDPDNTDYWMPEGVHDYPSLKKAALVADCTEAQCRDNNAQITLDSYSLSPGSEVTVEINSQPRLLGKFVAGDDGSLSAAVNLPDDLDEGYHTVHVYGSSFSGEAVDLYQVISYQKPSKPNDNTNNTDNTPPDAQAIVNSPAESGPVASVRPIVAENKIKAGADVDEQNLSHEVIHPEVMGAATTKPVDFAQANSPQKSSRSAGYGATFYYALVGVAVFVVALSVVTWLVANKRKPARG